MRKISRRTKKVSGYGLVHPANDHAYFDDDMYTSKTILEHYPINVYMKR